MLDVTKVNLRVWQLSPRVDLKSSQLACRELFPLGSAILLTDSLFLCKAHLAARILRWFQYCIIGTKAPLTWKIYTRPTIFQWLEDLVSRILIDSRLNQGQSRDPRLQARCQKEHDQQIKDWRECKIILEKLVNPLNLNRFDKAEYLSDSEDNPNAILVTPFSPQVFQLPFETAIGTEDSTPLTSPSVIATVKANDEALLRAFKAWSLDHLHQHRRWHVVVGALPTPERKKEWIEKGWNFGVVWDAEVYVDKCDVNKNLESKKRNDAEKEKRHRADKAKQKEAEMGEGSGRVQGKGEEKERRRSEEAKGLGLGDVDMSG
jgi:hypothetical protein